MNNFHLEEITSRLKNLEKKEILKTSLMGFFRFLIFLSAFILFFVIFESLFRLESGARTILFYFMAVAAGTSFLIFFILPVFRKSTRTDIYLAADKAGAEFPQIKDELLNALQLLKENKQKRYSNELVDAAFENVYLRSKNLDFNSAVKMNPVKNILKKTAVMFTLAVLLIIVIPGFRSSAFRIANFDKEFVIPPKFVFEVNPGNATLTKGEDLNISLKIKGDLPDALYLRTKSVEDAGFSSKKINTDSSFIYSEKIKNVKSSLQYFVEADEIKSETFNIEVIDPPQIRNLTLNIQPPEYSKLPNSVQKDNGNVTGLPGTKIILELESTKELNTAEIVFSDSSKTSMNIVEKRATTDFMISKEDEYFIKIYDEENLKNNFPIVYGIKTLRDENPEIEIISPAKDLNLPLDEIIFLSANVSDDYGFGKLTLNYRVSSSKYGEPEEEFSAVEIPVAKYESPQDVYHTWDLTPLRLNSEDVVSYYLEIFDNNNFNGPKSAKSKIYRLRVPSMDELFVEADEVHKSAEEELVETLKEAKKLNEEIEEISAELKKDEREISWDEKEKIENAMQKFEELGEKVDEVKEKINEMKNDLQQNELLSEETLKKYMELQELFDEMNNEDLKNAFEKMNDMLKDLSRKNVQNSFEEMKQNEEIFKKSIERTINLLKKIQVEQKVDELVKRTEELSEMQKELQNETEETAQNESEKNESGQNENLQKKQDEISESVKKMQEQMKGLQEKMAELEDMPMEAMEKIQEKFDEQQNQQLSEEAEQNLMQQMNEQAMQKQMQLSQNMQELNKDMQQMQSSMQQQNQMMTMQNMMKITDDLITMSKEQEKLKSSTQALSPGEEQFKQNAAEQNQLAGNIDKILKQMSDLSQKSFAITPEMGKAMGKAKSEMNMSVSALQNRNGNLAQIRQKNAMKSLNEAAQMMQSMMNQMMNGGGGGGMMSMMQQMQKLSQQQMSLNQLTEQLRQGEMSQQQLSQLKKLAQRQDMIRKSLQQLNNESKAAGESKKLTGNLEKILEDMKEAVTRMNTQNVNDDLVKQQERILSKLLDVQRSINERDFEEKRESRSGELIARESPPELMLNSEEAKDKIRDELRKAAREGYTRDYEELIKKYFEALRNSEE